MELRKGLGLRRGTVATVALTSLGALKILGGFETSFHYVDLAVLELTV